MIFEDKKTGADAYTKGRILYIYGTGEVADVLADIRIRLKKCKGIWAHRGAMEQAIFLYKKVNWDSTDEIRGHSLGGAVALILHQFTGKQTYAFGAFRPFPFWQKLKPGMCEARIHGADIVPRIFLFRKYGCPVRRCKGKGFHPFTDHIKYEWR